MATNKDITWAVKETKRRAAEVGLFQDYYKGNHRAAFATDKWETAFGQVFRRFRDNLCPAVVDTKSDRLQLSGFDTGEDSSNAKATDIWTANRMDRRAGEVHTGAFRDGDAFVIVWPGRDGQPIFYPQRAERIAMRWSEDQPGMVEVASKMWPIDAWEDKSQWRLTLYYPDRIERYVTHLTLDGRSPDVPDKPQSWDEWQGEDGGPVLTNEYGRVPLFSWNNNASTGEYGRSELADVIPLQDALNKTIADSLVAGEFAALPQRWATGLDVVVGPDGEPVEVPFEAGIDRIWSNPNPNGRFGQFESANMQQFVATADGYRAEIARVSRTPLHYLLLVGQFPSGDSQRTSESPLMAVVKDRKVSFGNSWEDAMSFALTIAGAPVDSISATWIDTTSVSEKEKLDGLAIKKDLGVPEEVLWSEMGYDEDQIDDFKAEAETRREQAAAAFLGGQPDAMVAASGMDASAQAISEAAGEVE